MEAIQNRRKYENDYSMGQHPGVKQFLQGMKVAVIEREPVWTGAEKQTSCDLDTDFWNHAWEELALLRGNGLFNFSMDAPSTMIDAEAAMDTQSESEESLQHHEKGGREAESPFANAEEKSVSIRQPLKVDLDVHAQHWQRGWMSDNGRFIISVDVLEGLSDAAHVL